MKIRLVKIDDSLRGCDVDSEKWIEKQRDGKFFECDISAPRNGKFHRMVFKLMSIAFKHWNPEQEIEVRHIEKNFDQFREDITIMAGYHEWVYRAGREPELRAKSISYASMDNEAFKIYYDKILTVIIQKVLVGWSIEDIDNEIGRFL